MTRWGAAQIWHCGVCQMRQSLKNCWICQGCWLSVHIQQLYGTIYLQSHTMSVSVVDYIKYITQLICWLLSRWLGRCLVLAYVYKAGAHFCKISYDLLCDYLRFVVRSIYDSGLKCAKISLRNIASQFTNLKSVGNIFYVPKLFAWWEHPWICIAHKH